MAVPQGYKLDTPPTGGPPAGYTLDQPEKPESFLQGVWRNVNPTPLIKAIAGDASEHDRNRPMVGVSDLLVPGASTAIDVAKKIVPSMIQAHAEQLDKAKEAVGRGGYLEAAGHLAAAALPFFGPAAAHAGEEIGGTPPTMDKFGNVIQEGKPPNIEGGVGEAAGALLPFAAKGALEAAAGSPRVAGARNVVADALRSSAEKQYSRVLNATTRGNKARSAEVVPQLIDRGVKAVTLKGLQAKAAAQIQQFGEAIGQAHESLPDTASVPLDSITAAIKKSASDAFEVAGPSGEPIPMSDVAKAGLQHADGLTKVLEDVSTVDPVTGEKAIPVPTARRLRQYYDDVAAQAGRYDAKALAEHSTAAAHGMAADAIRAELAKQFPDIAALNKEYSFWKDVNRVVTDTMTRRQGQAKPLGQKLAAAAGTGAGFATGGIHGAVLGKLAMGQLEALTTSPAWQTVSAVLKNKLANAIAAGQRGPAEFAVAKIAQQVKDKGDQPQMAEPPQSTPSISPPDAVQSEHVVPDQQPQPEPVSLQPGPTGARKEVPIETGASPSDSGPKATTVIVPGEDTQYKASYQLRDLADIQASHNGLNFNPNERYAFKNDRDYSDARNQSRIIVDAAKLEPRWLINSAPDTSTGPPVIDSSGNTLGGNSRVMKLQRAYQYHPQKAGAYRDMLASQAKEFGIDPNAIAGMKRPVLVRVLDDSELNDPARAITDFNKEPTAKLTSSERGTADARYLSPGTLQFVSDRMNHLGADATLAKALEGKFGPSLLRKLQEDGVFTEQELPQYQTANQKITPEGKIRISRLLTGRIFRNSEQFDNVSDSLRNTVEKIAPEVAKASTPGWDLTPKIQSALDLVEQFDPEKFDNFEQFRKQQGLFGGHVPDDPMVDTIAKALLERKPTEVQKAFREYANHAKSEAEAIRRDKEGSMFETEPRKSDTPDEAFQRAFHGKP